MTPPVSCASCGARLGGVPGSSLVAAYLESPRGATCCMDCPDCPCRENDEGEARE